LRERKEGDAILKELSDQGNILGRTPLMVAIIDSQEEDEEEEENEKSRKKKKEKEFPQVYIQFLGKNSHFI